MTPIHEVQCEGKYVIPSPRHEHNGWNVTATAFRHCPIPKFDLTQLLDFVHVPNFLTSPWPLSTFPPPSCPLLWPQSWRGTGYSLQCDFSLNQEMIRVNRCGMVETYDEISDGHLFPNISWATKYYPILVTIIKCKIYEILFHTHFVTIPPVAECWSSICRHEHHPSNQHETEW